MDIEAYQTFTGGFTAKISTRREDDFFSRRERYYA